MPALLFVLLHLSGKIDLTDPQSVMRIIDLTRPPPPPPPPPPTQNRQPRPKEKEGGSAPKNIRSQATPVVAPKPRIVTPPVQQIAASETPRQGTAPTQGASNVRGPGTGAGGIGNGTGNGNGGNGPGGGGGGVADPPHLVTPVLARLRFSARDDRPMAGASHRIHAPAGRCSRLGQRMHGRSRHGDRGDRPANLQHRARKVALSPRMNRSGQPVAGWFGYAQPAPR